MDGHRPLGQQIREQDVNAGQKEAHALLCGGSELEENNVHKANKILDICSQTHVFGELTPLCMLSTWKEPNT